MAVANPTQAGDYTVTATLDNPNYTAPAVTGTLVIGQATPTLTWADPGEHHRRYSTGRRPARCDRLLRRDAAAGRVDLYTPGRDRASHRQRPDPDGELHADRQHRFQDRHVLRPDQRPAAIDTDRHRTHAMVIGEQPVFRRKLNKHGKPVGKAVLTGFTLDFNMSLSAAAASNPGNYELDTVTTKKVKKSLDRVLHPIKSFTVTYTPASDSVTLKLAGAQSFPTGGQITVLPGVTSGSGSVLSGTTVFTITPGGKKIEPS